MPSDGVWDEESVGQVARYLAVNPLVVRHQIQNQSIGELEDAYD